MKSLSWGDVDAIRDRVMSLVEFDTNGGCWLWTGNYTTDGYGHIWIDGRKPKAHRVSFALHGGDLSAHQAVLHSCDVRACINPAHLRGGTFLENVHDCMKRSGRVPFRGRRITPEVRAAVLSHTGSLTAVSKALGVPKTTVVKIRKERNG